jgi:tocopherol O-methyltransferase
MPDKEKFMKELIRVTAPGGRIMLVTWCHRELNKKTGETSLKRWERGLLQKISDGEHNLPFSSQIKLKLNHLFLYTAYYLPEWCPVSKYVEIAQKLGLEDVRKADWSEFVAPFWPAVFMSALIPTNFLRMLRSGWTTIKGAIATVSRQLTS